MTSASSWIIQRQERGALPRSDQWRRRPNAALLKNGEVLAIGETISMHSEPYNPSTGSWNATGNTGTAIINPITPLFSNAEVFATVGFQSSSRSYSTTALYDLSTGQSKPHRAIAAGLTAQCPYPSKQAINSA